MSKHRVFANNNILNFNDYLKYKNGKEIIKNIKTKSNSNKIINHFLNYENFILLTKTYFKYFITFGIEIGIPVNIYNSNTSFIVYDCLVSHINGCNTCRGCKDIIDLYDCDAVKGILYPYGKYIEYVTNPAIFLHNRINLDNTCKPVRCKNVDIATSVPVTEFFPSQNNFITQPIQYDNYSRNKQMNAYAVYPRRCVKSYTEMINDRTTKQNRDSSSQSENPYSFTFRSQNPQNSSHSENPNSSVSYSELQEPHSPIQSDKCNSCPNNLCKKVRPLFIT